MGIIYFEENALEVPKHQVEGLEEWEKVALKGFRGWLQFWGLEACKDNSGAVSLIDFGMNMPRPTEEHALGNLERQARMSLKLLQTTQLENVYLEVLALDRYYLKHYERHEFRVRYWQFIQEHVGKGELSDMHRYGWIAERMDFYTPKGNPNKALVLECLERADARVQLADDRHEMLDLSVDISHLLVVRRETKVA